MPIRQRFGNWTNFLEEMKREPKKWIPSKHGHTRKGSRNKKRKRIKTKQGYIKVFEPNHPMAWDNGYVFEHRKIAYDAGKLEKREDEIHHINGNKTDNRIENLKAISKSKHTSLEHRGKRKIRKNSKPCNYPGCNTMTSSEYGLCRKHYKLQWQRKKEGRVNKITDLSYVFKNSELLDQEENKQ